MNKYKAYVIASLALLSIVILAITVYLFWLNQTPGSKEISVNSVTFTNHWLNYSDETSDEYIDSWSSMVSEDFTDSFKATTSSLKEMRGNNKPTVSVFTPEGTPEISLAGTSYTVVISGEHKLSYEKLSKKVKATVVWNKTNRGYKITDAYTDK